METQGGGGVETQFYGQNDFMDIWTFLIFGLFRFFSDSWVFGPKGPRRTPPLPGRVLEASFPFTSAIVSDVAQMVARTWLGCGSGVFSVVVQTAWEKLRERGLQQGRGVRNGEPLRASS